MRFTELRFLIFLYPVLRAERCCSTGTSMQMEVGAGDLPGRCCPFVVGPAWKELPPAPDAPAVQVPTHYRSLDCGRNLAT
jgi:hypothetical protein